MDDISLALGSDHGWRIARDALVASIPLLGLSVILHRNGRRGVWPLAPWLLALVFGPLYHFGLGLLVRTQLGEGPMPALMAGHAWSRGAYASLFVMIVFLAIFGLRPRQTAA